MKQERVCFLCGRNGAGDPLEEHHIYNASNRSKSDKLGLTVYLCGNRCHRLGKYAVHHNAYVMNELKRYTQREFMMREGVGLVEFRLMFGKSYIGEDEGEIVTLFDLPVQEREMRGEELYRSKAQRSGFASGEEEGGSGVQFSSPRGNGTARASSDVWESAKREYRMSMDAVKAAMVYEECAEMPY